MKALKFFTLFIFCSAQLLDSEFIAKNLEIKIDVISNTEPNDGKYIFEVSIQNLGNFELTYDPKIVWESHFTWVYGLGIC